MSDMERVEKTGTLIGSTPWDELSEDDQFRAAEELAIDSAPKLLTDTLRVEKVWSEEGSQKLRISGEKHPIWEGDRDV